MDVREVASKLKVREVTVRNWLQNGKMKGIKTPERRWEISAEEVERMRKMRKRRRKEELPEIRKAVRKERRKRKLPNHLRNAFWQFVLYEVLEGRRM